MAVASRTTASDPRVPCSMCGGLVHPIAGKCKHCKADLAAARSVRPAAATQLPRIGRAEPVIAVPAHAAVTQVPIGSTPVALPAIASPIVVEAPVVAREAYNPMAVGAVLPPRPTGRMRAADERSWLSRNWPVFVIVLASIAIVLAVILMLLPPGDKADAGKPHGSVGPAPERMETDPLPKNVDPWNNGAPQGNQGTAPPTSPTPTQPIPTPDPDDQSSIDPDDPLADPFASPRGGTGGLFGGSSRSSSVGFAILGNIANRLCEKAKTCSDPTIATMCSAMTNIPVQPLPASCPQAQKCMSMIDQIDVCDGSMSGTLGGPNFPSLMLRTTECMDAIANC